MLTDRITANKIVSVTSTSWYEPRSRPETCQFWYTYASFLIWHIYCLIMFCTTHYLSFFRFTKKYVSPVVLTLLLHLVCKYCVHFSQPCQEVGQIAGPCQPMFRNTIFPAFNEKKSVADVIVQTISNLKVCLLRSLWSIQYEKLPSQFEMRLFLRTVSPCCQWHEGDVWPEAWCGAMRGIIKVRTGSNPTSDWTDYEPCSR